MVAALWWKIRYGRGSSKRIVPYLRLSRRTQRCCNTFSVDDFVRFTHGRRNANPGLVCFNAFGVGDHAMAIHRHFVVIATMLLQSSGASVLMGRGTFASLLIPALPKPVTSLAYAYAFPPLSHHLTASRSNSVALAIPSFSLIRAQ